MTLDTETKNVIDMLIREKYNKTLREEGLVDTIWPQKSTER